MKSYWCKNGCGKSVMATSEHPDWSRYKTIFKCHRCDQEYINSNKKNPSKVRLKKLEKVEVKV